MFNTGAILQEYAVCGHSFAFLAPKALFLPPLETTITTQIDPRYTLLPSLGVQLSGEVPFVIFEWLVWELPPDNQRVSNSVFSVSSYILGLRYITHSTLYELL